MGAAASPLTDPTAAITSGAATFEQAYTRAGGGLAGTAAVAAGIVAGLPPGQLSSALNQVEGLASSTEAGAAVGSIIPGFGTVVGGAIGAVIGAIEVIGSSPPQQPVGEFRTHAERYVFPALPLTPTVGESPSALVQTAYQPVLWNDYRTHAVAWQGVATDEGLGDPAPSQTRPITTTFGVGWVSPPGSTPASTQQAYFLATAWMSSDSVSRHFAYPKDTSGELKQLAAGAANQAVTALGSQQLYNAAMTLFRSWYVQTWSLKYDASDLVIPFVPTSIANEMFGGAPSSTVVANYLKVWKSHQRELKKNYAWDYTTYFPRYICNRSLDSPQMFPMSADAIEGGSFKCAHWRDSNCVDDWISLVQLPDTVALGLAELACLSVTGGSPHAGADVVALHYLLGLAWLWRRGMITDAANPWFGIEPKTDPVYSDWTHPNVARCIGLVQAKIRHRHKGLSSATATTKARASLASALAKVQAAEAAPRSAPVAPVAPTSHLVRDLAIAGVVLAAGAVGVVSYKRRKRIQ